MPATPPRDASPRLQIAAAAKVCRYDAIIVGAGFAGLYQLHQLRDQLGLSAILLEAGDGVGGTWYWNRYPGARCDSESYTYSYSFSPDLEQEWVWTERYPDHTEIRSYLNHVADRFSLRKDIQFGQKVARAAFDDATGLWTVTTAQGSVYEAQFFITAVGCLSSANIPSIPGLENFQGQWVHTGHWPHEGVEFSGRRVGLIGTGSTGIQAVPVIATQADRLTVFQRTANYSIPARNSPFSGLDQAAVKANYPALRDKMRSTINGHAFDISPQSALDVDEAERQRRYEAAWEVGGLGFRAVFADLLRNKQANDTASEFLRGKIRQIVEDEATAARLVPTDHPFATKRPPIDTGYFETFNCSNVGLVDLKADPIVAITQNGIQTASHHYDLDVIVFATGFDAMTGPLLAIDITGEAGRSLRDDWAAGPHAYLGLQVPGFPNMFTVTGPGSPSVLTNMPVAIEQHTQWITKCIDDLRKSGRKRIEATRAAADDWVDHVNDAANATLLPLANSSWYLGANVPGKPRVFMPYAGGMARYAAICADVARDGYLGFART